MNRADLDFSVEAGNLIENWIIPFVNDVVSVFMDGEETARRRRYTGGLGMMTYLMPLMSVYRASCACRTRALTSTIS